MCIYKTYTIINTEREKMKLKNFKTAKDIFAKTYNRKMFHFMDFGEISRMKKVVQVKQTKQKERNKK
tara:strand:+ start:60 stop:260 length:201 start_codon:yes stop_codon:yes gene_type:complete